MAVSPANIEQYLRTAKPAGGYWESFCPPLSAATLASGAPVTGSGNLAAAAVNGFPAYSWGASGTTTDILTYSVVLPRTIKREGAFSGTYGGGSDGPARMRIRVSLASTSTGTQAANDDLAFTIIPVVLAPGAAAAVTGTTLSVTLPAKVADTDLTRIREYDFDIGSAFTEAQRRANFVPGAKLELNFSVNEAVGAGQRLDYFGFSGDWLCNLVPDNLR